MTGAAFPPARLIKNWVKDQPTPCYLYDEAGLRRQAEALFRVFSWSKGLTIRFPIRMNPLRELLLILKDSGCGVECGNLAELRLAEKLGFTGDSVLYAPLIPDEEAGRLAMKLDAVWLVNGVHTLPPEPPRSAVLCYNPRGYLTAVGRRICNLDRNRFGMDREELLCVAERFCTYGETSLSLGFRAGDNETDAAYPSAVVQLLLDLANSLCKEYGITVSGLDLGSIPAVSTREGYEVLSETACSKELKELLDGSSFQLSLLPGRYLAAPNGVILTRVCAVVQHQRPMLLTDCSHAVFPRPMLGAWHPVSVLGKKASVSNLSYDIYGCLTDPRDRIAENRILPQVSAGDYLIIHGTGADSASLSSHYGGTASCPQVLLHEDRTIQTLKA